MQKYNSRLAELKAILQDVKYQDWVFHVGVFGNYHYLQVQFLATDITNVNYFPGINCTEITPNTLQKGRKFYISRHATKQEVVLTAWLAVRLAIEHEAREQFLYKGRAILGPHIDLDALVTASYTESRRK